MSRAERSNQFEPQSPVVKEKPATTRKDSKAKDLTRRTAQFVRTHKYWVGAGVVLSGPFVAGLAQGLNPVESVTFGVSQLLTIGAAHSPTPDLAQELTHELGNRDLEAAVPHLQELGTDVMDAYKGVALQAGIYAALTGGFLHSLHKSTERKQAILEGRAKVKPYGEKVFLLGGQNSYIADTLDGDPEIFPVFESPDGAHKILQGKANRKSISRGESVYLNLDLPTEQRSGFSYLESPSWDLLEIHKKNLIHADNGKRYLVVIGCGNKAGKELSIDPGNVDVSQDDLRSATLRLREKLKPGDLIESRDVIDVYIGNGLTPRTDIETGTPISDRDLARTTGVDIYIDTWALFLRAVANKLTHERSPKNVRLATTKSEYQARFQERFFSHMKHFPECRDIRTEKANPGDSTTLLVYEGDNEETLLAARRIRKGNPDKSRTHVIALVSGSNYDSNLERGGLQDIEVVSASQAIADAITVGKEMLRQGRTPDEVQKELDKYAPPLPVTPIKENEHKRKGVARAIVNFLRN